MATDHNFRIKNGLEVGGQLIVNSSGQLVVADISANQKFLDNVKLRFGNSSDLQIYHDASIGHSIITDTGTGNLLIRGTNLNLQDASGYNFIVMEDLGNGGVVKLRHNDVTKLETTSTGVTVTGDLSVSGDLNITGDINSVSVTDLDVVDKTITVGQGQSASNSTGSGLVVSGSNANILWDNADNRWEFNKDIFTTGALGLGNSRIYKSGDSNHLHLDVPTAIIGPSTTTSSNPSLGTSSYRFDGLWSSTGNFAGNVVVSGEISNVTAIRHANSNAQVIDNDNNTYFIINDPEGMNRILIGDSGDRTTSFRNNVLSFQLADSSERMRMTSDELKILSDGSAALGAQIRLQHANNNSTDVVSTVNFANNVGSVAMIQGGTTGANNTGYISFHTDAAGTSSEKMRITTTNTTINGDMVVGGAGNGQIKVRHIDGKSSVNTGYDALYLNYATTSPVVIGHGGSQSDLQLNGVLRIGTTAVIDTDRNLSNIGTISSSYFNTSGNINGTSVAGATVGAGRLGFDQTGTRSWTMGVASGYLNVFSGDGNGDFNLANNIGLRQNGTLVLTSAKKLINIASIEVAATGTTPSAAKLHVGAINSASSSAIAQFGGFIRASSYLILHDGAGSANTVQMRNTGGHVDLTHGEGSHATPATRVNSIASPDGTKILYPNNNSNIMIGSTSTPATKLHVNSGGTNVVATFQSTDGIAGIKLQDSGGNVELSNSGSVFRVQPSGSTPVVEINPADAPGSIFTTKNVGLGNASTNIKVAYPGPDAQWSASGTSTGQVIIDLPGTLSNYDMMYMEIDIYEYSGESATKLIIGGHNWNSGGDSNTSTTMWYNVDVRVLGEFSKPIYFGWRNNGSVNKRVIVLGEPTSSWSYGTVHVAKVSGAQSFYSGATDWASTWNVSQTTGSSDYNKSPSTDFNGSDRRVFRVHRAIQGQRVYADTDMRAPHYYDLDNTGFYTNPASTSHMNAIALADGIYHKDDMDTSIQFTANEQDFLVGGVTALHADSSRLNINPNKSNFDFRVSGDNETNLIYADASADKVGIGIAGPNAPLQVVGTAMVGVNDFGSYDSADGNLMVSNGSNATSILLYNDASAYHSSLIHYDTGVLSIGLNNANSTNSIKTDTAIHVNADGVGIGNSAPDARLHVQSNHSSDYIAIFKQTHTSNLGTVQIDTPSDSNARPSRLDFARGGVNKWKTGMVYGDSSDGWGLSDATGSGTALQQTRFLVQPGGNVGINNNTPQRRFTVTDAAGNAGDNSGILSLTVGTGANTDSKMAFGIDSGHRGWINVVKPGSDVYPLLLNPTGSSNGKVGIGLSGINPSAMLDVNGNIRIRGTSGRLYFDTLSAASSNFVGTINNYETVVASGRGSAGFGVFGNSDIRFGFGTTRGSSETDLYISNSDGKVGIGTTNPGKKLEVNVGGGNTDGIRITGSSANTSLIINNTGSDGVAWDISSTGSNHGYGVGALHFGVGFGTPKMKITSDGKIGIGVNNPTTKLHIDQTGNTRNDGLFIERNGSTYGLNLYVDSSGYGIIGGNGGFTGDIIKLDFNQEYVGIATSPTHKLHVAGDIRINNGGALKLYNAAGNGWGELKYDNSSDQLTIQRTLRSATDLAYSLGTPSYRWGNVYAKYSHAYEGFSSDTLARQTVWRAIDNSSNGGTRYVKICRVTASQSSRFSIELTGRSTSYGDGSKPAFGRLVGQLNNDDNYDFTYYDFNTGSSEVVTEIGQVDIDGNSTDIYVKITSFAEVVAVGVISDGTILPTTGNTGASQGVGSAPSGYSAVTKQRIIMENTSGNVVIEGSLAGKSDNTTEIGTYSTGAIKRIRMAQGGELHFGDTTTSSPLGITEGEWNNFGDQDRMSIYYRNSLKFFHGTSEKAQLTSTGIFSVTGSVKSPIYYDTNNTSNFLDISNGTEAANIYGTVRIQSTHADGNLLLHYNGGNDTNTGTITTWISEPGISYNNGGIGANIHENGPYYGRFVNSGYGVYARFKKSDGLFEILTTTANRGSNGGQGTRRFYVDASGNSYSINSSRSNIFYDSGDTNYYVQPGDTTISGKFRQTVIIGDGTQLSTNDGSWGARLNLTDSVHSRIEIGQDANSMRSHWYAHTGQDSVKFGTYSNHDVEFQRNNTTVLELAANDRVKINPGATDYTGHSNVDQHILSLQTDYTGDGHQNFHFVNHNGNWQDGTTGGDTAYGLLWGYQNYVRAGIHYDHRGIEKFDFYSTHGDIRFRTPASATGNTSPIGSETTMPSRLTIAMGGAVTIPHSVRSDIFYDNSNTSYYVNPQTTSNLTHVDVNGFLRIMTGSIGANDSTGTEGLIFDGNYTNGQYRHRFRKQDLSGGLPLFLDYAAGTANSYSTIARFGPYASNNQNFEVYGGARVTGNLELGVSNTTQNGYLQLHGSSVNKTAELFCSNGNLHIDADSGNGIYMNWYGGTAGTLFGNGSAGQVAAINGSGAAVFNTSVTTPTYYSYNSSTYFLNPYEQSNYRGGATTSHSARRGLNFYHSAGPQMTLWYHPAGTGVGNLKIFSNSSGVGDCFQFTPTGAFHAKGDITAYSTTTTSDARLKENVRDLEGSLDKTLKLRGVKFDWIDESKSKDNLGFIAQEVEEVIPEVVKDITNIDGEEHKVVNYQAVVPVLVEAIKELKAEINELREQLKNK